MAESDVQMWGTCAEWQQRKEGLREATFCQHGWTMMWDEEQMTLGVRGPGRGRAQHLQSWLSSILLVYHLGH